MNWEDGLLVADDRVEFAKNPVEVQDLRENY